MSNFPFASYFGDINVLADLQFMPGEKPYIDRPSAPVEPKELLLYLGCNVLRTAHLAKTVIDVLRQMGFDFNAAGGPAHCCGIIHHINGEPAQAQTIAANSMRHFARYGAQHVLMWCPSCHEQYDEVITQQQNVAFGYEHVTSFIARHLDRIPFVRRVEKRVALHYHTGHVQADRDWQHTRAILQAIPGLDLVHIDNPAALGRHCTPRWIGCVGRPTWQRTIADILDAAKGAGCDTVASIYHSCHREICVQEASSPISIVNYISLLGEAMGIEHPDIYKRFRLQADPQAAFQEVEPYVQAHGLNTDRVRKTLGEAFGSNVDVDTSNPS